MGARFDVTDCMDFLKVGSWLAANPNGDILIIDERLHDDVLGVVLFMHELLGAYGSFENPEVRCSVDEYFRVFKSVLFSGNLDYDFDAFCGCLSLSETGRALELARFKSLYALVGSFCLQMGVFKSVLFSLFPPVDFKGGIYAGKDWDHGDCLWRDGHFEDDW